MRRLLLAQAALMVMAAILAMPAAAQKKKVAENKGPPRVILVLPLGAAPGTTTKLTVRGFGLEGAKEIRLEGAKGSAKIVSTGKAPVFDKNPDKVGDTQVEVMLTIDAALPAGPVALVVVTPAGATSPHPLLVETQLPVRAEKEPNDGFRQAQTLALPVVLEGRVERPRDVDVFRFEGKAGQKLSAEVQAARYGAPLDAILTLYNEAGQEIASNDDFADSRDARLEATLPAAGVYYLSLLDAHDSGSALHVYRLIVKAN
jgi:hypothetical protein